MRLKPGARSKLANEGTCGTGTKPCARSKPCSTAHWVTEKCALVASGRWRDHLQRLDNAPPATEVGSQFSGRFGS